MATIRPNDNAPAGEVEYNLPTAKFTLGSGDSYETEDRTVLSDAAVHPWLTVEYPEVDEALYARPSKSVPFEKDYLGPVNSVAFNLNEVRKIEEAKREGVTHPTAIQAGLDQSKAEEVGDVNVTVAADEADSTDDDKPRSTKRAAKQEEGS